MHSRALIGGAMLVACCNVQAGDISVLQNFYATDNLGPDICEQRAVFVMEAHAALRQGATAESAAVALHAKYGAQVADAEAKAQLATIIHGVVDYARALGAKTGANLAHRMQSQICHLELLAGSRARDTFKAAQTNLAFPGCRRLEQEPTDPGLRLVRAAECGDLERVTELLAAGVSPLASEPEHGKTAIHFAAQYGHRRIVELLLKKGVDPDLPVASYTPLMFAAARGNNDIVSMLIKHGADVHRVHPFGTPLILAMRQRHISTTRILLKAGARIDQRVRGKTALYVVAEDNWQAGDAYILEFLLKAGADPTLADERGRSAMDVANPRAKAALVTHIARKP